MILEGAIVTNAINNNPISESIAAPVTLALVVIVAFPTSPIRMRQLIAAPEDEIGEADLR